MPHYMSQGVNELAASGVEKSVKALQEMTLLSVTGVEEIAVFVIGMMTNTYACLITMAVTGSISSAVGVLKKAQNGLDKELGALGKSMSNVVDDFLGAYNKFTDSLNGVTLGLGIGVTAPKLDLDSELKALNNLKLPADLTPALDKINSSLPTFEQVKNLTDNAIRFPFEEVKGLIRDHLGNYSFDRSIFPTPEKQQLTFCSDNDGINDFFDQLVHLAAVARTVFIGVLLAAAILVCFPMAWREIKRWRTMQERSALVGSRSHDPMDVVYIVSRPYTATAGIKAGHMFNLTRRQILTRWVFAYATSEAALFVLSLGLAGLFSVACQAIMLKAFEKEVPDLTNQVGAFADKVVSQLNNASQSWAVGTNGVIDSLNEDINSKMLGWVNTTTGAINDTLNVFVTETMDVLNVTFGGTVLYEPILDVLDCLVLMKIRGIEKALTWVSDNAHVDFPALPADMFSLGAVASIASNSSDPSDSFLSQPGDEASDQISAAVARFLNRLEDGLRTEALIATVIVCIWLFIVLIGILRALTLWFGRDKTRGEGGVDHFRSDPPPDGLDGFDNVPLGEMQTIQPGPPTPAPKYSQSVETEAKENPFSHSDDRYLDQKIGYAGQRNFSRQDTGHAYGRNRIVSSQAHLYDDFKS